MTTSKINNQMDDNDGEYENNYDDDNMYELETIDEAIISVTEEMEKYIYMSLELWNDVMMPFMYMNSDLLNKVNVNEPNKFIDFMLEQETYVNMMDSLKKLKARKRELIE
jgi:hypothetical protein